MKNRILLDMGTTNTRIALYCGTERKALEKLKVGAGTSVSEGKDYLFSTVRAKILEILETNGLTESDLTGIYASGMAGSGGVLFDFFRQIGLKQNNEPASLYEHSQKKYNKHLGELLEAFEDIR